jgi:O-antigen/teichoic acid export membrane protein
VERLANSGGSLAADGLRRLSGEAAGSLCRNAAAFFVGQLTYTGCVWLLIVVVARVGGAEPVGQITFALALAAPIVVATQLGLRQVLNTDSRGIDRFDSFRHLRLALSLIAAVAIAAVGFALGYRGEALLVIGLIGATKAQDSIGDIYHAVMQRAGRLHLAGASLALRGVLLLVLCGAGFALTQSIVALAIGMALASAIVLGAFDRSVAFAIIVSRPRRTTLVRSYVICRRLFLRAAPLGLGAILVNFNCNVPRYAIEGAIGPVGLGHYSAMDNVAAIGSVAVQAVGQALFPRLADLWAAGDRRSFASLSLLYVALGSFMGLLGVGATWVGGRWILETLYGAAFVEASPAFRFIMAASVITYAGSALGYIVMSTGRFKPLVWLYAAVVVVTSGVAYGAVPLWGLAGAAAAVAAGHLVGSVATIALLLHLGYTQHRGGEENNAKHALGRMPAGAGEARAVPEPVVLRAVTESKSGGV